jgi:hypothetical protein
MEMGDDTEDASAAKEPAMTEEHRWGEPIPPARQAELHARIDA